MICEECGARVVNTGKEMACERCGLVASGIIISDAPTSLDLRGREVGQVEPQTVFQPRAGMSPEERSAGWRLRKTALRHSRTDRERTDLRWERAIRDEASRLGLSKSVVAVAILISKNLPRRGPSVKHRAAASLIVGAASLDAFADLGAMGWDDRKLRLVTQTLAERTGVRVRRPTASDYLRVNATIAISEPPFNLVLISRSELVIATMLAEQVEREWHGSPRTLASGICMLLVRYTGRDVSLAVISTAFGLAKQSVLLAEKKVSAMLSDTFERAGVADAVSS